jgi:cyclopropane fatty-acyl-phospholipid synthase-like methyltransferase
MLRFRVGECNEIGVFQAVGEQTAKKIQNALSDAGYSLEDFQSVLDFGCGCGRTLVWLCKSFPGIKWHGTDVDAEAIKWCCENIAGGTFAINGEVPPLSYRDETFDFIYAFSVFTHLNGDAQRAWKQELRRIVKPGGIVLLTIHSEFTWKNFGEAEAVEREGQVFRTSGKLRGILPEWYHTTFQTREYTIGILSEQFEIVKYFSNGSGEQDIFIVRARTND